MKLTSVLVQQPGLLVDKPWRCAGYHTKLSEAWELEAVTLGVVASRDGGRWLVPWSRVQGCEVSVAGGSVETPPLTASVGAVSSAVKGTRKP